MKQTLKKGNKTASSYLPWSQRSEIRSSKPSHMLELSNQAFRFPHALMLTGDFP